VADVVCGEEFPQAGFDCLQFSEFPGVGQLGRIDGAVRVFGEDQYIFSRTLPLYPGRTAAAATSPALGEVTGGTAAGTLGGRHRSRCPARLAEPDRTGLLDRQVSGNPA
jgi:hypothetical protein